jgi:hypothetical protein
MGASAKNSELVAGTVITPRMTFEGMEQEEISTRVLAGMVMSTPAAMGTTPFAQVAGSCHSLRLECKCGQPVRVVKADEGKRCCTGKYAASEALFGMIQGTRGVGNGEIAPARAGLDAGAVLRAGSGSWNVELEHVWAATS